MLLKEDALGPSRWFRVSFHRNPVLKVGPSVPGAKAPGVGPEVVRVEEPHAAVRLLLLEV